MLSGRTELFFKTLGRFSVVFVVSIVRRRSRRSLGQKHFNERQTNHFLSSQLLLPLPLQSLCFIFFWQFFLSFKSSLGYLKTPICPACARDNSAGGSSGSAAAASLDPKQNKHTSVSIPSNLSPLPPWCLSLPYFAPLPISCALHILVCWSPSCFLHIRRRGAGVNVH